MASQEEWEAAVQQYAQEHNFSLEEAAEHLKKEMGVGKIGELMSWARLFQPEENPLVKAVNEAIAQRVAAGQPLFGPAVVQAGQGGAPAGGGQPNNITTAITHAKEAGVQSIYLPDGTMVNLQAQGEGNSAAKNIEQKIKEYVDGVVSNGLPNMFNPPGGNNTVTNLPPGIDPTLAKLVYEDKWKEKDREAENIRSKARDETIAAIAASIGAGLSPEGFEKIKQMIQQGGAAGALSQGKQGGKLAGRMIRAVCWKCGKPFRYDEGEEAVCPYCGTDYKVQCQRCKTFFTPTNAQEIICPKCGAEYTLVEEKEEEGKEEKPSPTPGEEPSFTVGSGFLE